MHIHHPDRLPKTRIVVLRHDGHGCTHKTFFESIEDAFFHIGHRNLQIDEAKSVLLIRTGYSCLSDVHYGHHTIRVDFRDDDGHFIDPPIVMAWLAKVRRERLLTLQRRHDKRSYRFRHDPVPLTGKRGSYKHFRRVRTFPERREAAGLKGIKEEVAAKPRAKRTVISLPSEWDDIGRQYQRSWKSYRRTQWKN